MEWKALMIIILEVDAVFDGKPYKGKLSPTQKKDAESAFKSFPSIIKTNTSGNATLVFPGSIIYINKLTKVAYVDGDSKKGVFPDPKNVYDAIIAQGGKWDWGQYDSVFVVHQASFGGWGNFKIAENRGATYATLGPYSNLDIIKCNGEAFVHEWLHGVCGLYEAMGYAMPPGNSDAGGALGYKDDPKICFQKFYQDLMSGNAKDQTTGKAYGGVPTDAWKIGTLKEAENFAGYSIALSGYNKQTFKDLWKSNRGVPVSNVHKWGNGYIQDFESKDGHFSIMQGIGSAFKSAYLVLPEVWKAFLKNGDTAALGYPTREYHGWGLVNALGEINIQDFETNDGWHSGIMNKKGTSAYFVVKGDMWRAYVASPNGGANSYLKCPTENERKWKNPDDKKDYWIQFFEGGWCWASTDGSNKYGNNKDWKGKSVPTR